MRPARLSLPAFAVQCGSFAWYAVHPVDPAAIAAGDRLSRWASNQVARGAALRRAWSLLALSAPVCGLSVATLRGDDRAPIRKALGWLTLAGGGLLALVCVLLLLAGGYALTGMPG